MIPLYDHEEATKMFAIKHRTIEMLSGHKFHIWVKVCGSDDWHSHSMYYTKKDRDEASKKLWKEIEDSWAQIDSM